MEEKYRIIIGIGVGAAVGGLAYSVLKKIKTSFETRAKTIDNLTLEGLMGESMPACRPFEEYKAKRQVKL